MADTGYNSPSTVVNDASIGTVAWSNPGNATASDDVYASANIEEQATNYLKATNFGFNIPSGATINGIEVQFESSSSTGATLENAVRIVKSDGSIGTTDKSGTGSFSPFGGYVTRGGSSDLWGETWSPSDINNSNFGFALSAAAFTYIDEIFVDHIRIKVFYTPPASITGITQITGATQINL